VSATEPVRVAVIGVGMIGQDHIRRLSTVLSGARVVAVSDVDADRAKEIAATVGAAACATGEEAVVAADVDAVMVTSWGGSHEQYVTAAIAAGKPVFCEKPLADAQDACARILDVEVAHGARLVQVGFMRRYDPAYRALKQVVDSGTIGAPLIMHCGHRNPSVPAHYTREMAIVDTAVHEIDLVRWLFGEEITAVRVLVPRKSKNGGELQDPLMVIFEMASGAIVDVEVSVNIRYGYDIRGEIVGEEGTVALADSGPVTVRLGGTVSRSVPADWRERFIRAYDIEIQEWLDGVAAGAPASGPSSWDGYAAQVVAEAGLAALASGERATVSLRDQPALYA
jgi:myo-inositol 2-dehydrogenase/D-chiro-inositol 1-dehydrogenase